MNPVLFTQSKNPFSSLPKILWRIASNFAPACTACNRNPGLDSLSFKTFFTPSSRSLRNSSSSSLISWSFLVITLFRRNLTDKTRCTSPKRRCPRQQATFLFGRLAGRCDRAADRRLAVDDAFQRTDLPFGQVFADVLAGYASRRHRRTGFEVPAE